MYLKISFVVAAAAEEICKYYTFRSVEHPDLIFLTGLDRARQDVQAKIGGEEAYPYSSNNTSTLECGSFESTFSTFSSGSKKKNHRGASPGSAGRVRSGLTPRRNKEEDDEEPDIRTVRQRAAAVTTAMISGAVGLACAENFIYVFFLSGSNTQEEIAMLLFRSIFPVHALCAGMQSIGVIKKFLEEGEETSQVGVGKIVFPAILLHGTFDSVLMLINSYVDIVSDVDDDFDVPYDPVILNSIAACCITTVMIIAFVWYYRQNRHQKASLKVLELELLAKMGQLPSPDATGDQRELELL